MSASLRRGTRTSQSIRTLNPSSSRSEQKFTPDLGMKARATPASATFLAGSTYSISGAIGEFSTPFGTNIVDPFEVRIQGTNLNDGVRLCTAVTVNGTIAEYLTIAHGVKSEGPLAGVEIRTP